MNFLASSSLQIEFFDLLKNISSARCYMPQSSSLLIDLRYTCYESQKMHANLCSQNRAKVNLGDRVCRQTGNPFSLFLVKYRVILIASNILLREHIFNKAQLTNDVSPISIRCFCQAGILLFLVGNLFVVRIRVFGLEIVLGTRIRRFKSNQYLVMGGIQKY